MLVDVTTPAWSLLYSNDAFTAETGAPSTVVASSILLPRRPTLERCAAQGLPACRPTRLHVPAWMAG